MTTPPPGVGSSRKIVPLTPLSLAATRSTRAKLETFFCSYTWENIGFFKKKNHLRLGWRRGEGCGQDEQEGPIFVTQYFKFVEMFQLLFFSPHLMFDFFSFGRAELVLDMEIPLLAANVSATWRRLKRRRSRDPALRPNFVIANLSNSEDILY